ncbi:MAG: hypothetical protein KKF56_01565 [Nanoarchaeota archaeon]|nr:hypothetical protein [Nanoarchaeota archaeon]
MNKKLLNILFLIWIIIVFFFFYKQELIHNIDHLPTFIKNIINNLPFFK